MKERFISPKSFLTIEPIKLSSRPIREVLKRFVI